MLDLTTRRDVYGILRVDETDPSLNKLNNAYPLIFRPSSTVRGQGSVNHIRGECREDAGQIALKMFVNGVEIGDASDSHFHGFQQAAIVAYSTEPGTEFRYDNFVADVPD